MQDSPRPPRTVRVAFAAAVSLLALSAPSPALAQRPSPTVSVSVPGAPAGTEVTVRVGGLTPGLMLQIGFGGLQQPQEVLGTKQADDMGNVELVAKIPDWVERHRIYFFFIAYANQPPRTVSNPFIATAAEGFVRVAGNISNASAECAQVRGFDETIYTLVGNTGALQQGARVVVEGTVGGEAPAENPAACGSGAAIPVRVRQVLPG